MAGTSDQQSRGVWERARTQHGVVARWQLTELGFGRKAIEHRLRTGRLHPIMRGVYAVGRPTLTRKGTWMAAVLACGDGAMLSHSSAAALWEIGTEWQRGVEISIQRGRRRLPGLVVHRRRELPPGDVMHRSGIPATSPALTLLDHAARVSGTRMERMINEADRLDLANPAELRHLLDDHPRRSGVTRLKRLLDRHTFLLTESALEQAFLPIAAAAGLPAPLTGQRINGFKVDFLWPRLGLVVETDGLRYHRTPAEQARDRVRDQAHTAAGLTQLRFTHEQVKYQPEHVRRVLAATAEGLRVPNRR